jgi:leucyl/phenylalanyl-tRNA--protein transferase
MTMPEEILGAYLQGYFPMAHPEENNKIYWHLPEKRGIIPLDSFHVPKNLKRLYRNNPYTFRLNSNFEQTIRNCSKREETWISADIISMYLALHEVNLAWSVEVWEKQEMVGGLYGVVYKKAFFGESMFSKKSNTSKLALVHLVGILKSLEFELLDCQYLNPHLKQFGAVEIEHKEYMDILEHAIH